MGEWLAFILTPVYNSNRKALPISGQLPMFKLLEITVHWRVGRLFLFYGEPNFGNVLIKKHK